MEAYAATSSAEMPQSAPVTRPTAEFGFNTMYASGMTFSQMMSGFIAQSRCLPTIHRASEVFITLATYNRSMP
ncbi:MAG: hypothetical protein BWY45_03254 [Euryarchaeota archaeon ADurb.Bin294]|nr:MAG: hypothetical protein BWY45_03254 [Euryarchaeota archaeon ADurb.Bin294]